MDGTLSRFSAVVVSYQTGPVLDLCLAALIDAPLCHQIILVNNGNPPMVVAALNDLARTQPKLIVLDGHGNIGFGRGCNLGAHAAGEKLLVFVNPDCLIDAGAWPVLAQTLNLCPDVLVGGALRNQDGSEQRGCRRGELTLWSAVVSFAGLGKVGAQAGLWRDFNRTAEPTPLDTLDMPVVSGALMAVSRAQFDKVGGFDPAFFLHVEDVDLCRRIRESGGRVMYAPKATALHIGATSGASTWAIERAKIASFGYYFWKNAHTFLGYVSVVALMPVLALVMVVRMVAKRETR